MVFARLRRVIFVHGCFWHRHPRCKKTTTPAANAEFWRAKFSVNRIRDRRNIRELKRLGWQVLVVWECETNDPEKLRKRLVQLMRT
jgi:DNA mismatch endonuclease (patch repair protein)